MEVCVKLAELGADFNEADYVNETCCDCISVGCYIIILLTLFFELGCKDGLSLGSVGSMFETG